jgi:hypothetical protein
MSTTLSFNNEDAILTSYEGTEHGVGFKALQHGCGYVVMYLGETEEGFTPFYSRKQHDGRFEFMEDINCATFFASEEEAWSAWTRAIRGWESSYISMIKFPKTQRLEVVLREDVYKDWRKLPVYVTEKLDGANVGISFDESLRLQSRGHYLVGGYKERQFDLFKQWARWKEPELARVLGARYLLFGEWLFAKHRAFYDNLPGYFVEYDVYDEENDLYLSTPKRRALLSKAFTLTEMPTAPILFEGIFGKVNNFAQFIGPSHFKTPDWKKHLKSLEGTDDSILMEGIYIRIEDDEKVVGRIKLSRPEFEKVKSDDSNWFNRPIIQNLSR